MIFTREVPFPATTSQMEKYASQVYPAWFNVAWILGAYSTVLTSCLPLGT